MCIRDRPHSGEHGCDRDKLVVVFRIGRAFHHAEIALVHHTLLRHVPIGALSPNQVPILAQITVKTVGGDGYGSRQDFIFRLGRAVATCFTDGGKNFSSQPLLERQGLGLVRAPEEKIQALFNDCLLYTSTASEKLFLL